MRPRQGAGTGGCAGGKVTSVKTHAWDEESAALPIRAAREWGPLRTTVIVRAGLR